jgi:pimeloyl-ACP methyl ester carboxylesterase
VILSSTKLGPSETANQLAEAVSLQNDIAADFPRSHHVYVEDSGHYIQLDKPDLVVDAVREIAGCR